MPSEDSDQTARTNAQSDLNLRWVHVRKRASGHMRPAEIQISLRIHIVEAVVQW